MRPTNVGVGAVMKEEIKINNRREIIKK